MYSEQTRAGRASKSGHETLIFTKLRWPTANRPHKQKVWLIQSMYLSKGRYSSTKLAISPLRTANCEQIFYVSQCFLETLDRESHQQMFTLGKAQRFQCAAP